MSEHAVDRGPAFRVWPPDSVGARLVLGPLLVGSYDDCRGRVRGRL
jgi:hypothetical protein